MTNTNALNNQIQAIVVKEGYDFTKLDVDFIAKELGIAELNSETKSIIAKELQHQLEISHTLKYRALMV